MDPLPARVRLVEAPGALRDVELDVFGWRTEHGETMVRCRLVDGSMGTIPTRWTDLPRVGSGADPLGVIVSPGRVDDGILQATAADRSRICTSSPVDGLPAWRASRRRSSVPWWAGSVISCPAANTRRCRQASSPVSSATATISR